MKISLKNCKSGYVDANTYDKEGDLKIKGKKKFKTDGGEIIYEDIDYSEED